MAGAKLVRTSPFPAGFRISVRRAGRVDYKPGGLMEERTIFDNELIYVWKGSGIFVLNKVESPVKKDDLILLLPGIPHSIRANTTDPFKLLFVHFDVLLKDGKKYALRNFGLPGIMHMPQGLNVRDIFLDLTEEFKEQRLGYESVMGAYVTLILATAYRHVHGLSLDPLRARLVAKVQAALDYLHANFHRPCSTETLAALVYLHPVYFARVFKQAMGCTPHTYLIKLRIQHAKRLIMNSDLSFTQVAEEVGFKSIHQFSRTFKRIEGLTPSEYLQSVKHL